MKILYVNSCVRKNSRTNLLAEYLLDKLDGEIEEVKLNQLAIKPLNSELLSKRDKLINNSDFNSSVFNLAKQFKQADIVVVSAPYWDLSFPSLLKIYFENINVSGVTFQYSQKGVPETLCNAKKLYYITTSGGFMYYDDFGFGYVKALSNIFYGINDIQYIKAEGLDIFGADIDKILSDAKMQIDMLFDN